MEERLRKFSHLVEAGNFTKAAQGLHISQPALSAAISKLERELRVQLLVRDSRNLQLTDAGRHAYATAQELQVSVGNLAGRLAELNNQEISISIGMIDSIAHLLFQSSRVIDKLEEQAHVSIVVDNSYNLTQAVTHNAVDVAFVVEHTDRHDHLIASESSGTEPLSLVCHAAQADIFSAALSHDQRLPRFISYNQQSTTHRLVLKYLAEQGIQPEILLFSTSPEIILRLVQLQKGCAVLPYHMIKHLVSRGTLVQLGSPAPIIIQRHIALLRRRDRQPSLITHQLADTVQQLLD